MKRPANDALAVSALIGAAVLSVWLGIAGPLFNLSFGKLNNSAGLAAWAQAIIAGGAIIAVFFAATIPVRAEAVFREKERRLRAKGMALLLIPEILVLKGEIETCIEHGSIYDPPVVLPSSLANKTDELYILGETGGRLLQAIGMVNGVAAQTKRFQAVATVNGAPIESKRAAGIDIWKLNLVTLRLCLMNLDATIERIS